MLINMRAGCGFRPSRISQIHLCQAQYLVAPFSDTFQRIAHARQKVGVEAQTIRAVEKLSYAFYWPDSGQKAQKQKKVED